MTYDATNRAHIKAAEREARIAARQRGEVVTAIMSHTAGRAWILELLEASHVFASSFSDEPTRMAFNEGERNIGLRLFNDIVGNCPDEYITMMRERNERDRASDARRESAGEGLNGDAAESGVADDSGVYRHPSLDGDAGGQVATESE